jgi:hypothetical protein
MAHRVRAIVALFFLVVLWACNKKSPSSITGPTPLDSLPYYSEAANMALFYSEELHPPDYLVRKYSRELTLIRDRMHDSVAIPLNTIFQPSWEGQAITILFDTPYDNLVIKGEHSQWNQVVDKYGLITTFWRASYFGGTVFNVHPSEVSHPFILAQLLRDENLEGVVWVSKGSRPHWSFDGIARSKSNSKTQYFFYQTIHPDLYGKYYYIEVEQSRAHVRGTFQNFPDLPDSLLWRLPDNVFDSLCNELDRNRPQWVDSASHYLLKTVGY